jgi:hypothetical protein
MRISTAVQCLTRFGSLGAPVETFPRQSVMDLLAGGYARVTPARGATDGARLAVTSTGHSFLAICRGQMTGRGRL